MPARYCGTSRLLAVLDVDADVRELHEDNNAVAAADFTLLCADSALLMLLRKICHSLLVCRAICDL